MQDLKYGRLKNQSLAWNTAIRLGTFFKTSAEFWMNLQMTYNLRKWRESQCHNQTRAWSAKVERNKQGHRKGQSLAVP